MKKETKNIFSKSFIFNYLLFIGIAFFLLNACQKEDSSDVNQDKIWTEYVVHYNQNDDKTHVVARFRFGNPTGTLLELSDSTGANVTFNGTPMPYSIFWSGHHLNFAGNITTGTFSYTNTDGITYTNSVPAGTDSIAFPSNFDTIIKSQAQTFYWVGNPLSANQDVGMGVLTGNMTWNNDVFDALFYTQANGADNLVMGVQAKSGLEPGQATAYIVRRVENSSINGTSKGGVIRYSYRPFDKNVSIVP